MTYEEFLNLRASDKRYIEKTIDYYFEGLKKYDKKPELMFDMSDINGNYYPIIIAVENGDNRTYLWITESGIKYSHNRGEPKEFHLPFPLCSDIVDYIK